MDFWESLTAAGDRPVELWTWEGETPTRRSYAEALADAERAAGTLRRRGVRSGDVVPGILTNSYSAIVGLLGVWFAGAAFASLPAMARGMTAENYLEQVRRIAGEFESEILMMDDEYVPLLPSGYLLSTPVGFRSLLSNGSRVEPAPPSLDDLSFIQFSSGATAEPRGVMLTGRAITAQLAALGTRLELNPTRDRGVSWLPLSHDMGLFGCVLLAWANGMPGVLSTPQRFVATPETWLRDCAEFGATLTAAPPFALRLALRAPVQGSSSPSSLRACLLGGEHIPVATLHAAQERLGIEPGALTTAYGLAEATLAVTSSAPGQPPKYRSQRWLADATERSASEGPTADAVSCGTPLDSTMVRIDDRTGEIVVQSSSLASGYWGNPDLTRTRFADGWLRTGDVGVIADGELYVLGRLDDLLSVGGRNINAVEVEQELGSARGIRQGCCAIVAVGSPPRMVMLAESTADAAQVKEIAQDVRRKAMRRYGLPVDECLFVRPGHLPKTPSGKVQRFRCAHIAESPPPTAMSVALRVRS